MHHYRLNVAYDGSNYYGFQQQKDKPTIQGELEKVFKTILKDYKFDYSGRTDSGVHAKEQVLSLSTPYSLDLKTIRSMNKLLGESISINKFVKTSLKFHARYDATKRTYKYFISNSTQLQPYLRNHCYIYPDQLSIKKLNNVAQLFVGEHNFTAFSKFTKEKNPLRTIYKSSWSNKRDYFEYTIIGNSFLRNMVRNIVGVQIAFMEEKISIEEIELNLRKPKNRLNYIAPPNGLILWKVKY